MENFLTNGGIVTLDGNLLCEQNTDISLRLFDANDIPRKVEWINNPENNRHLHYDIPLCCEKTLQWFHRKDNTKRMDCVIEYKGVPVGLIGLLAIDRTNSKAEFYISMGEPAYKNRGIATAASIALVQFAFKSLRLHKIYLNTDGENYPAHRLFEKVGFVREGYFREDMFHRGKFIDRVRYALINDVTE